MGRKVFVIGVGMTKFEKPQSKDWDYPDMAREAGTKAIDGRRHQASRRSSRPPSATATATPARLLRARPLGHPDLQREQQLLDRLDGALHGQAVRRGRPLPSAPWRSASRRWRRAPSASSTPTAPCPRQALQGDDRRSAASAKAPPAAQMFGNAGREHMEKYGTKPEHFAKIGWKNHKHSVNNPYSQFQDEYSLEDILNAPHGLRPAHQAAVLPHLGRLRRGDPRQRGLREEARPRGQGGRDPRHGDDDRLPELLRGQHDQDGRPGHDEEGRRRRSTSSRASGRRTSTSSSCTTASRATS